MISRILRSSRLPSKALGGQEARPDELLGDRRAAARPAVERVDRRPRRTPARSKPGFDPEVLVLDRRRRVEDLRRELVEVDDLALALAEAGELDVAGAVEDDRLLVELEVVEGCLRFGQAAGVVRVGADRAEESQHARRRGRRRRGGAGWRSRFAAGVERPRGAAGRWHVDDGAGAAPGWSACRRHDSMRVMFGRPPLTASSETPSAPLAVTSAHGVRRPRSTAPTAWPGFLDELALAGPVPRRDAGPRRAPGDRAARSPPTTASTRPAPSLHVGHLVPIIGAGPPPARRRPAGGRSSAAAPA